MAYRVNALMNTVQTAGFNPPTHGIPCNPRTSKLSDRDHAMLSRGDFSHAAILLGDFCVHMTHKSPATLDSSPAGNLIR
jgi:hypothetical protein